MASLTRLLLVMLVFSIPFDQGVVIPGVGSLSRLLGLLAAGSAVLTFIANRSLLLRRLNLLLLVAGAFVALNGLSVFWSIDPATSLGQTMTYVQLWVMAWILWQFVESDEHAFRLRQAYLVGTWITIGVVITAFILAEPTIDEGRYSAFGTNANYTAQSIALAIPMALDAAVHRSGWRRWTSILLVAACVLGIALTGSRSGGLVGLAALVLGVLLIVRIKAAGKGAVIVAAAGLIVSIGLILPAETRERFLGTVGALENANFTGRTDIWEAGLEVWSGQPALGVGSGAFEQGVAPMLGGPRAAHNSFLNVLVELGPIGAALLLSMFVVAAWPHLSRLLERAAPGRPRPADRRVAALHVVLVITLFLAQQAANWQYSRATWFVLLAATLECALIVRAQRPVDAAARPRPSGRDGDPLAVRGY